MSETFRKSERLSGVVPIATLMRKGRWGSCGPLKYCTLANDAPEHRLMVSVPKRLFKRAVKRNHLKRLLRESYRTQKSVLDGSCTTDILLVYNSRDILPYTEVHALVGTILGKVAADNAAKQ